MGEINKDNIKIAFIFEEEIHFLEDYNEGKDYRFPKRKHNRKDRIILLKPFKGGIGRRPIGKVQLFPIKSE